MKPEVDIVLATFNGEAFLGQQLDSIAEQTFGPWRLLVFDDGSSDGTMEVLERYRAAWPAGRLVILPPAARRLGASAAFGRLLEASTRPYVCLCDQDDEWLPDRLSLTIDLAQRCERASEGGPVLAHADLAVVDAFSTAVSPSLDRYQRLGAASRTSIRHLLVQNSVTGCTIAMNRPLVDLALPIPEAAVMHDWWLALVAAAFGNVVYEPRPLVRYRQHGANLVGARRFGIGRSPTVDGMRASLGRTYRQADALWRRFGDRMEPDAARVVRRYAEIPALGPAARRQRVLTDRFFKVGVLRTIAMLVLM